MRGAPGPRGHPRTPDQRQAGAGHLGLSGARVSTSGEVPIRRLEEADWAILRDLRLALLADAPSSFGSTLAREQDFDEATWRGRTGTAANFVAFSADMAVGIAAGHHGEEEPAEEVQLVSMWVHPDWRRRGLAARLTAAVVDWARSSGYGTVRLWVAVDNAAAERTYVNRGFTRTGVIAPIRPDEPSRLALEMRRHL